MHSEFMGDGGIK
jgi:dynein heavy chain